MRKIAKRVSEIQERLRALHSTLEKEQRALNDEEKRELAALEREQDLLLLQSRALAVPELQEQNKPITAKEFLRALVNTGRPNIELRVRAEGSEATTKDTGSGIMCIEDGRLCGIPVFCSETIGAGKIGLGDFTYQVCAQFGDFYLTVDPYTGADANKVKFVLNADFGTATLRPEAFALYSKKTA